MVKGMIVVRHDGVMRSTDQCLMLYHLSLPGTLSCSKRIERFCRCKEKNKQDGKHRLEICCNPDTGLFMVSPPEWRECMNNRLEKNWHPGARL